MGRTRQRMMMVVAGTVAAGTLALGGAAVAGAAANAWVASAGSTTGSAPASTGTGSTGTAATGTGSGTGSTPTGSKATAAGSGRLAHLTCARGPAVLVRIQRREERVAAGLPKLTRAEAKAKAAGNTRRADRIQKLIARYERPAYRARLQKVAAGIEARCHLPAPPPTPTTAPGSKG